MAVRPFYMEANVDGRASQLSGGPKNKSGGMDVTIYQRDNGDISKVFRIESSSTMRDGKLILITSVFDKKGNIVAQEETEY